MDVQLDRDEYELELWTLYGLINCHYLDNKGGDKETMKNIIVEREKSPFNDENLDCEDIDDAILRLQKLGLTEYNERTDGYVFTDLGRL